MRAAINDVQEHCHSHNLLEVLMVVLPPGGAIFMFARSEPFGPNRAALVYNSLTRTEVFSNCFHTPNNSIQNN